MFFFFSGNEDFMGKTKKLLRSKEQMNSLFCIKGKEAERDSEWELEKTKVF
jgi:hypothetical protein